MTGGTVYLDGEKPSGVRIQAKNDDGWLRVEITADAGITGYSVSVNGQSRMALRTRRKADRS